MSSFEPADFEVLYPGVYVEQEKALLEDYLADNRALEERGAIDVQALVAGALPADTPGLLPVVPVAEDMVRYNNSKYDPENPLLHDAEHARALGYDDILAMPCFGAHDDSFMVPCPPDMRDTLLVSQLNHSVTTYRPIYPGDTLFMVANRAHGDRPDPTRGLDPPQSGAAHRGQRLQPAGREGQRLHLQGDREHAGLQTGPEAGRTSVLADVWEAPEWISRPAHVYTDADWDFIVGVWSKERRRGAEPLYWEDVNVGDEPTWTADGPIDDTVMPTAPFGQGTGGTRTLKREIMDPANRSPARQERSRWRLPHPRP